MCQRPPWVTVSLCLLFSSPLAAYQAPAGDCGRLFDSTRIQVAASRTADMAAALGLPSPPRVEVAPVPDGAAGRTFGPVVRLRPAPAPNLLAALWHEAGHIGVARDRDAEEAIADLTRRALFAAWMDEAPGEAASLAPVLAVPPFPDALPLLGGEALESWPMARPLYRQAALMAAVLWQQAVSTNASTADTPALVARDMARSAMLGRHLSSATLRRLASEAMASDGGASLRMEFLAAHMPLLPESPGQPGGTGVSPGGTLRRALSSDSPQDWILWAQGALQEDESIRLLAHEALAVVAPGAAGELHYLDQWVRHAGDRAATGEAQLRRGEARVRAGQIQGAARDLTAVVWQGTSPLHASEAIVHLARLQRLSAEAVKNLLTVAPAFDRCGAAGTALRAMTLKEAGHPQAALDTFTRGAVPGPSWAYVSAWSASLVAGGRSPEAVALLARHMQTWARQPAARAAARAAMVLLDETGGGREAEEAARELARVGVPGDRMLSLAESRWRLQGRERRAHRARARLEKRYPRSDRLLVAR